MVDIPFIEDEEIFKAVSFARKLMKDDLSPSLSIYKASKFYKVSTHDVAVEMGKFASAIKQNKRKKNSLVNKYDTLNPKKQLTKDEIDATVDFYGSFVKLEIFINKKNYTLLHRYVFKDNTYETTYQNNGNMIFRRYSSLLPIANYDNIPGK